MKAVAQFKKLIRSLADVGLQTEVRNGNDNSLLVFVKAADEKVFGDVVFRSRYVSRRCLATNNAETRSESRTGCTVFDKSSPIRILVKPSKTSP
jgi:hypothetical protein